MNIITFHDATCIFGRFINPQSRVNTSANWIFPVSTRSLASEQTGTECFTTGWRFKISNISKGAAELRSYLRAAIVMPTYKWNKASYWLLRSRSDFGMRLRWINNYLLTKITDNWIFLYMQPSILWQFKL